MPEVVALSSWGGGLFPSQRTDRQTNERKKTTEAPDADCQPCFTCSECQAAFDLMPHWRVVAGDPFRFRCRACHRESSGGPAFLLVEKPTCFACQKKIHRFREAIVCQGCCDVAACSEPCWEKLAKVHVCDRSMESSGEDEGEAPYAVGKGKGGGGGKGGSRSSAAATRRRGHPVTPEKARLMLHHGYVTRGDKKIQISDRFRRYLGHIASYGVRGRKGTAHLAKARKHS